jgi:Uncharacterized conserved protein
LNSKQTVRTKRTLEERVASVETAPADADFVSLFRDHGGLDPARHLRFFDWSGIDFSLCDLRWFNFTGANLAGCRFVGAQILGARFDAAQMDRAALRQAKDWESYAAAWRAFAVPPSGRHLPDLAVFSDAPFAPEMVVMPTGRFPMGSPRTEDGRSADESQPREVTIAVRFAIGRYPVTFEEYDHFCAKTGHDKPIDPGWGRGRRPVINASWTDARKYAEWLSGETGQHYRLPTEAEWEYACRAGKTTRFSVGDSITPLQANYGHNVGRTTKVGSYPANAWGVHDMHGQVWECVEDVWHVSHGGAPRDGSAWTGGDGPNSYHDRVVRGGSWVNYSAECRSAARSRGGPEYRSRFRGFRVARTLP